MQNAKPILRTSRAGSFLPVHREWANAKGPSSLHGDGLRGERFQGHDHHPAFLTRQLWLLVLALCFVFLMPSRGVAQSNQVQTLSLASGWNLIAFQVVPENPSASAVFGTLGDSFGAAWSYDNDTRRWSQFSFSTNTGNLPASMDSIRPGRAYWVFVNRAVAGWQVKGIAPLENPAVNLLPGWNLVGIPTGTGSGLDEPVNLASVMAAAGANYEVILKWELGQYKKFSDREDLPADFTRFDPNRGLWINVRSNAFTLQPRLLYTVRGDIDNDPVGNYPSLEDIAISDSPTPLGGSTQTNIVFFPGEESQTLSLGNTGGGILLWRLSWQPLDAKETTWLTLSADHGVTTVENDIVRVGINRQNLTAGQYRGILTLQTSAGNRVFYLTARVAPLQGEWKGVAKISAVSGKKNPIPDVDLFLSFYEDPATPGLLRGAIDGQNSVVWPLDVPLIGHVQGNVGNQFTLGGGYVLPPGDINDPPYDLFQTTKEDVDWNGNGVIDDLNPFPFPIYRSVLLEGALASGSEQDGFVVRGRYLETVYGMLRKPIRLEGDFELRRISGKPFSSRTQQLNVEPSRPASPVVQVGTNYIVTPNLNGVVNSGVRVSTDLQLQALEVELNLQDPSPQNLTISLIPPLGGPILLHDHGACQPNTLAQASYPNGRTPVDSFDSFVRKGLPTRGLWTLNVVGSGGKLAGWRLLLRGQPVYDLAGTVSSSGGGGVPAEVTVAGLPVNISTFADDAGRFTFTRIPGIPLNFGASLMGYGPTDPLLPGLGTMFTLPSVPTAGLSTKGQKYLSRFQSLPVMPFPASATDGFSNYGEAANPVTLTLTPLISTGPLRILASQTQGPAPLPIQFSLTGVSNPPIGRVVWDFGDGQTTNGIGLVSLEHTFQTVKPVGYTITATVSGAQARLTVYPMPSPGQVVGAGQPQFFQVSFTGGGSIPVDLAGNIPASYDPSLPPQLVGLISGQFADCASFDIDRAPYTTTASRAFDTDGFSDNGTLRNGNQTAVISASEKTGLFHEEDSNYFLDPNLWKPLPDLANCGYAISDDKWDPPVKAGETSPACAGLRVRMLCNIGAYILPPPNDEVYDVRSLTDPIVTDDPDPLLAIGREGIASARNLRLVTGPLAWTWKLSNERE